MLLDPAANAGAKAAGLLTGWNAFPEKPEI